jgi:hypothetical protein
MLLFIRRIYCLFKVKYDYFYNDVEKNEKYLTCKNWNIYNNIEKYSQMTLKRFKTIWFKFS